MKTTLGCFCVTAISLALLALAGIGVKGTAEQFSQTYELRNPPAVNYIELQEVVIRTSDSSEDEGR